MVSPLTQELKGQLYSTEEKKLVRSYSKLFRNFKVCYYKL